MRTAQAIEREQAGLKLWYSLCYERGEFEPLDQAQVDPMDGSTYTPTRVPADKRDKRHPDREYFWDLDVYHNSDGEVELITIQDEFYLGET